MTTLRPTPQPLLPLLTLLALPLGALAGGSDYGTPPGALATIAGDVREWPVPTPQFARDPAPAPDGSIFIAVMRGNRIARFEPTSQQFREWDLPKGAHPHGVLVDREGIAWYTGNGNGAIGRLDPATGKITEYRTPSGGDPHTLVIDDKGTIWFTMQSAQRIGRLDRATGKITEYETSGNPYGLAVDAKGKVWFCRLYGDSLGRLDPTTGEITEVATGSGSRPRRIATAPDGMLWVTGNGNGNGQLMKLDPETRSIVKSYPMPAGPGGAPYAVTVDAAGRVWANEIDTNTVAVFDPKSEKFRVLALPSKNVGIRKAIIDAEGRYWYMGSHNGRLGMIR